jgi:asparagine synthase (glutamine-hydrolysing)
MCGIFGVLGESSGKEEEILNLLSHRGPDDRGSWRDNGIFLGHCRLSIIDIAGRIPRSYLKPLRFLVLRG